MSRMAHWFSAGALIAITVGVPSAAQAQIPARVRVMTQSERIWRWLGPQTDVLLVVDQGTTLEVVDFEKEKGWYWVVLPADLHGTRRVGWIRASSVEPSVAVAASHVAPPPPASEAQRGDAQAQAQVLVAPSPSAPAAAEDSVAITVRHDAPAASPADDKGATKSHTFEDVHFERDSFSIRSDDIERLRVAAAALKDDPSLVMTIEGHTCSLGTGPYNLALGNRRASAVKDYLVSAGVPADRLVTVSQGEANAEYDNSHEETRRLNRRVALVPKDQR